MGWEDIAADKKSRIYKSIPDEWRIDVKNQNDSVMDVPAKSGILSSTEIEITNSSAVDLVAKLASGQLNSVDVTLAFCKRAALAHQLVRQCPTNTRNRLNTNFSAQLLVGVLPRGCSCSGKGARCLL